MDVAVLVSSAAVALSLPIGVAGFFLLRLIKDMRHVDLEELATQAFKEQGFVAEQDPLPNARELREKRRTAIVVRYCYALLALSACLPWSA